MLSPILKLDCSPQLLALFYLAENKGNDLIYLLSKTSALIPKDKAGVYTPQGVLPYMGYIEDITR